MEYGERSPRSRQTERVPTCGVVKVMVRSLWFAAVLASSPLGCSFNESPAGGSCIEGQELTCLCGDDSHGVHTCRPDGTFGRCMCTLESPGAGGTTPSPQAGAAATGAGGAAATGGASQGSAGDGDAGDSGGGMTGGGGAGAPAGNPAGSGGNPGMAGADAGSSGAAGGGRGGSAGDNSGPSPPEPGSVYTECALNEDCDTGLFCTASNSGQLAGYCTTFCDAQSGASCPEPRSGTVEASCVQFAGICALGSCQGQSCPNGMECMLLSLPFGGEMLWNCSY